jgi:hypothetical protein
MRSLRQSRLRRARHADEVNPMDGLFNLADVMLVFSCGLIIALIAAWNLDVSDRLNLPTEVDSLGENSQETIQNPDALQEMGTVYMDPETGKYYILNDENN